jgi:stringent starvation protein A
LEPVFSDKLYFLSDEFSLLDCALAPLLWRLSCLGIEIPKKAIGLHAYMQRLFNRESFQLSLSDSERQLRAA